MIPYNTDAPLYHMPIATVGLIVLNTILFLVVPTSLVSFESSLTSAMLGVLEAPDVQDELGQGELGQDESAVEDALTPEERSAIVADLRSASEGGSGPMLSLEYGRGVKPWQWLTSIFMHANVLHLVFNMIALWAFGLVVEGKVGLGRFLAIYLGIGVSQSAIEQLIMCINGVGGSLGASAAIFGILGVAMVWAPKNDFEVFYQFGFRMGTTEVPIMVYGFLQLAVEIFYVAMGEFGISSGLLHLMGFAIGMGLGFVWLVRGWVDCEGWDLLTVIKGHEGRDFERERLEKEAADLVNSSQRARSDTAVRVKQTKPQLLAANSSKASAANRDVKPSAKSKVKSNTKSSVQRDQPAQPVITVMPRSMFAQPAPSADDFADLFVSAPAVEETQEQRLLGMIENGKHQEAIRLLIQLKKAGTQALPQPHLAKLIGDLLEAKDLHNAIPLMAEHVRRFSENRLTLQINLAKILLQKLRPAKALQVLKSIDCLLADEKNSATISDLVSHAETAIQAQASQAT